MQDGQGRLGLIVKGCQCQAERLAFLFCRWWGDNWFWSSSEPEGVWRMNWGESSGETVATAEAGDTDPEPRWRGWANVRKSIGWVWTASRERLAWASWEEYTAWGRGN